MPIICAASAHAHHSESLLSFTPRQPWLWNALTIPILQMRSRTIKEIKIRPKISEGMKITEAALNPDVLASMPRSDFLLKQSQQMIIPSIGASEKPRLKNMASFHRGANVWIWSEYCRTTLNKIGKDWVKSRLYRFLFFPSLSCSKPFQISLLALFQILNPGHLCSWIFVMKTVKRGVTYNTTSSGHYSLQPALPLVLSHLSGCLDHISVDSIIWQETKPGVELCS